MTTKNGLAKITQEFEGATLITITYKGRPAWIAKEVGAVLGYSKNGGRFVENISNDWGDEFISEKDFVVLKGDQLHDFKQLLEGTPETGVPFSSQMMILFETGMHLALIKSNKPVGKRLRKFITNDVMPQIARDGSFLQSRKVKDGKLVQKREAEDRKLALAEAREARLDRQLKSKAMNQLVKILKKAEYATDDMITSVEITAVEQATDQPLKNIRPPFPQYRWKSPTQIAHEIGSNANTVGRAAKTIGIKDDPKLSYVYLNNAPGQARNVPGFTYSPEAEDMIKDYILNK